MRPSWLSAASQSSADFQDLPTLLVPSGATSARSPSRLPSVPSVTATSLAYDRPFTEVSIGESTARILDRRTLGDPRLVAHQSYRSDVSSLDEKRGDPEPGFDDASSMPYRLAASSAPSSVRSRVHRLRWPLRALGALVAAGFVAIVVVLARRRHAAEAEPASALSSGGFASPASTTARSVTSTYLDVVVVAPTARPSSSASVGASSAKPVFYGIAYQPQRWDSCNASQASVDADVALLAQCAP